MLKTPENGRCGIRHAKSVRFDQKPAQVCLVNPSYDPVRAALDRTMASNFVRDRVTRFPEAVEQFAPTPRRPTLPTPKRRPALPTQRPPALPPRNNPSTSAALPNNALPASAAPSPQQRVKTPWLSTRYFRCLSRKRGDHNVDGNSATPPLLPPPMRPPPRKFQTPSPRQLRTPSPTIQIAADDNADENDDDNDGDGHEARPKENGSVNCFTSFTGNLVPQLSECTIS